MPSSLENGKIYKIISVASAKLVTAVGNSQGGTDILSVHDRDDNTQKWRAEVVDKDKDIWKLRNEGVNHPYIDYTEGEVKNGIPLAGGPGGYHFRIDKEGAHPYGIAEHRIYFPKAQGATTQYVVDLRQGSAQEDDIIQAYESNNSAAQFWLFQEVEI